MTHQSFWTGDVAGAYSVFETPEFTAEQRTGAYEKVRCFLEESDLPFRYGLLGLV